MRLELEAVLDDLVGLRRVPYEPLRVIGTGFGHAFGIVGQLRIEDRSGEPRESIRQMWPGGPGAHDELLARFQYMAEWMVLRGPPDEDLDELRANGFDPAAVRRGQEHRAQQEHEQAARFDQDPRWRRGRIRDVISGRYFIIEFFDMLSEGLAARGATIDEIVQRRPRRRAGARGRDAERRCACKPAGRGSPEPSVVLDIKRLL